MSYTKQNWQTGETITADKLNHIENGIEESGNNEPFVVIFSQPEFDGAATANKTYAEIMEAFLQHKVVYGLLDRVNGMLIYQLQGELNPAGIRFTHIDPYINEDTVTGFQMINIGITSNNVISIHSYNYPS